MNLVAKEYVAAQDADDPGVLILSRFAGAAIEFQRAVLVNPYDAESVAGAIAQALAMPLEERRARHHALLAAISEYDVDRWQREFLAALRGDDGVREELPVPALPMRPRRGRIGTAYPDTAAVHWEFSRKGAGAPTARIRAGAWRTPLNETAELRERIGKRAAGATNDATVILRRIRIRADRAAGTELGALASDLPRAPLIGRAIIGATRPGGASHTPIPAGH